MDEPDNDIESAVAPSQPQGERSGSSLHWAGEAHDAPWYQVHRNCKSISLAKGGVPDLLPLPLLIPPTRRTPRHEGHPLMTAIGKPIGSPRSDTWGVESPIAPRRRGMDRFNDVKDYVRLGRPLGEGPLAAKPYRQRIGGRRFGYHQCSPCTPNERPLVSLAYVGPPTRFRNSSPHQAKVTNESRSGREKKLVSARSIGLTVSL